MLNGPVRGARTLLESCRWPQGEGAPIATDIFAKIGDIKGQSVDSKHKDEIEVLSFS